VHSAAGARKLVYLGPRDDNLSTLFSAEGQVNLLNQRGRDFEQGPILNLLESMRISVDNETPGLQLGPFLESNVRDKQRCDLQCPNLERIGNHPQVGEQTEGRAIHMGRDDDASE